LANKAAEIEMTEMGIPMKTRRGPDEDFNTGFSGLRLRQQFIQNLVNENPDSLGNYGLLKVAKEGLEEEIARVEAKIENNNPLTPGLSMRSYDLGNKDDYERYIQDQESQGEREKLERQLEEIVDLFNENPIKIALDNKQFSQGDLREFSNESGENIPAF